MFTRKLCIVHVCALVFVTLSGVVNAPEKIEAATVLIKPPNKLGLVGYWKFDEANEPFQQDSSGRGHAGSILGNPTIVSGVEEFALSCDGTGDAVNVGESADWHFASNDFSIELWLQITGTISAPEQLLSQWEDSGGANRAWRALVSGTGRLVFNAGENLAIPIDATGGTTLASDTWYHAAFVRSGSAFTIYLNGESDGTDATAGGDINDSVVSALACAQWNNGATAPHEDFEGKIDEVKVYNGRALTQAEVRASYQRRAPVKAKLGASTADLQKGSSLTSGLVGHWTFDGKDLTDKVYDISGQGNNGYFVGLATSSSKTAGKLGQAARFDGTTSSGITLGDVLNLALPISFSVWVRIEELPPAVPNYGLISTDKGLANPPNHSGAWMVITETGAISLNYGDNAACGGPDRRTKISTNTLTTGEWHHIIGVIQGATNMNIYIDGVDAGGTYAGTGGALVNTTRSASIGGVGNCGGGADLVTVGLIDDVRVYNRALSADEAKKLYNLGQVKIVP